MKPIPLVVLIALSASPLLAAEAGGSAVWTGATLKGYAEKLAPKVGEDHFALEQLGDFGSHFVLVVYREGNGPAESHASETDFYVVQSGSATLHLGGRIVDAKTVEEGEVRGSRLDGAKTVQITVGDTVNIPPGTPHQVTLAAGEKITYMIVKVHARK